MTEDTTPQEAPSTESVSGNSALDRIRRRRDELATNKTLTLLVPGYEGLLGVRYQAIADDALNAFVERAAAAGASEAMKMNADILVGSCQEIVCRQADDADWEPIDPAAGSPVTFSSPGLNELFGVDSATAREAVFAVFSPDGSQPMAAAVHSDALVSWMSGNRDDIDSELLGE